MMEVDGQSGHHAAESTTAEIRQRNACAGQHLPAGIIEKSRIVPDVHVSVVVAMRRHHDRAIHFEPVLMRNNRMKSELYFSALAFVERRVSRSQWSPARLVILGTS